MSKKSIKTNDVTLPCFFAKIWKTTTGFAQRMGNNILQRCALAHALARKGLFESHRCTLTDCLAVRNVWKCLLNERTGWSAILFRNFCKATILVFTNSGLNLSNLLRLCFSGRGCKEKKPHINIVQAINVNNDYRIVFLHFFKTKALSAQPHASGMLIQSAPSTVTPRTKTAVTMHQCNGVMV